MEIFNCRLCDGSLKIVLDLGKLYISGFIAEDDSFGEKEPLALAVCEKCGFAQLKHIVEPDRMYRQYWYKSSLNKSMLDDLMDVVSSTVYRWTHISRGKVNPIAIDIGANDGSMLAMYPKHFTTIGFDPALNLREEAEGKCDVFVPDYFSLANCPPGFGKADIVTAIAMFYDLNNPRSFLRDVHEVLHDNGIFVIQMADMVSMLKANAFDNICHEHAGYYTLVQAVKLLGECGFIVFDVEHNDVNGGSIRLYIAKAHSEYRISETVLAEIGREAQYLESYDDPFLAFSLRVTSIGLAITKFMLSCMGEGYPVYALGASTKGNTLLQYFGLSRSSIVAIGEINEEKFGKRTVGTGIPIVPEEEVLAAGSGILMILPWHFSTFFIDKLWGLMEDGAQLLFPLPYPRLVGIIHGELVTHDLLDEGSLVPWAT